MGYLLMLKLFLMLNKENTIQSNKLYTDSLAITILLTVHNEENNIKERINNLLELEFDEDLCEIIVASDGSTDKTKEIVTKFNNPRIKFFESSKQLGKTGTQNLAIQCAKGDVIVFTDACTRFDKMFLKHISESFSDPSVGAVDGHLLFISEDGNVISKSHNYFWQYELSLREAESNLGILAVASGACLAVRTSCFRNMDISIGEDCIVPLDVVEQKYRVVHASNALAFDKIDNTPQREFSSRIRMTLRNWQGTWSFPNLLNPMLNPGIAWSLWSHKIFRWLSPFLIIILTASSLIGTIQGNLFLLPISIIIVVLYMLALFGLIMEKLGHTIPVVNIAYSFILANVGILIGVLKALAGHKIFIYRNKS